MCDKQKSLDTFKASKKTCQYLHVVKRDWDNGQLSEDCRTANSLEDFWTEEAGIEDYERVEFDEKDGVLSLHAGFQEVHLKWIDSQVVGKKVIAYSALESEDPDLAWAGESESYDEWIRSLGGIPVTLGLTAEQRDELASEIGEVSFSIGLPAPAGVFYTLEAVQGMIDAILGGRVS